MNYKIRRSKERQYFDHGWLKTYHTFSFASYYDPNFMGFRNLRVINEDRVQAGHGFPLHNHQNMEIISLVLEGDLAHQDSLGNESILHANEIQTMSAGTGITHSEYNPSKDKLVHFLQIWIIPDQQNVKPQYQQKKLMPSKTSWTLLASKGGHEESLPIHQDVTVYLLELDVGKQVDKVIIDDRYGWLQMIDGEIELGNDLLKPGDGIAFHSHSQFKLLAKKPARALYFDLN